MHLHLEVDFRQAVPRLTTQVIPPLAPPLFAVRTGFGEPSPPQNAEHSISLRIRTVGDTMDVSFYVFSTFTGHVCEVNYFPPLVTQEPLAPTTLPISSVTAAGTVVAYEDVGRYSLAATL